MMPDNDVGSDLAVLNERCLKNGIPSPVKFLQNGKPSIENRIHIDLYEVFKKELVKGTIFKNKYRTFKLEDFSQTLLGKGKYGSGAISGADAHTLTLEQQKQYVLQDAQLVMDLSKVNNGQIMSLMQSISELTGLSLEQVCHSNLSTWWMKVFDDMGCVASQFSRQDEESKNRPTEYQGGLVIEPKRGLYKNLKVVDVVSLYPSVAILHNISFDTVNCSCCISREDAKVPADIIDKGYWICKQRMGAFPKKLRQFKEERVRQKQLGNEEKQLGLKILINGGYGLFGNPAFKYADVRVAELITAYGRHTLRYMQELAQKYGFDVIAGDTDSLFLSGGDNENLQDFINRCQQERGIEVEHQRTLSKFMSIKKKHYIGIDSVTGEAVIKGMEGKKSDRPRWVSRIFEQFVQDFKDGIDPTINIKKAIGDLESQRVEPEDLKIYVSLSKDPAEYATNTLQKRVGLYLGAKKGDVIYYYKSDPDGKKDTTVPIKSEDISIPEYKKVLLATVKDALEIMGLENSICTTTQYASKRQGGIVLNSSIMIQNETTRSNQSSFEPHTEIPQCHPFVKWVGGKTQLLSELEKYIPHNFTRYFEPFLGGGAFFFYLVSSKQLKFTAYLSDVNKELINAYRVIKDDDVEALIELLRINENRYKANPVGYYNKLRTEQLKPLTDLESAARFITLNKTCYNGLYRVNKQGMFNVPIGRHKNPLICDTNNLRNVSMALRHTNAHLFVSNYQKTLELAEEGDFVYLDPPYKPTSTTASFTSYTNDGFKDKDQIALHETFKKLDRKGCKIMISNSDTPFIRELYSEFKEHTNQVSALRAINCKATKRIGHRELLIRNYKK